MLFCSVRPCRRADTGGEHGGKRMEPVEGNIKIGRSELGRKDRATQDTRWLNGHAPPSLDPERREIRFSVASLPNCLFRVFPSDKSSERS